MPRGKPKTVHAPIVEEISKSSLEDVETLLVRCLEPKATSADVGRLYKQREYMQSMVWDSPECLHLKSRLVACFESRIFYKSVQGINFLVLAYNLHPLMVAPITEVLRKCIMAFPHAQLQACSQVLLKAWQGSSGGVRLAIEQSIAEWMRKALFTSTRVAERVRFLLSEIHLATRSKEIDDMLSRNYGPILFRNTKVANWEVRFNAIALLCAAFPVMPPDRTAIEFEEKLTAQFRVLKDSMEDPNEAVRKCAVVGTGRILRDFWEVLTIEQIAMVLDCVTEKAGRDKKSVKTRTSSIDAISLILDNPLSHGVMAELLPSTKQLLNDESAIVRVKYAQLLIKASKFKTISIPRFIDQGILFSRIASDHALGLHHPNQVLFRQIASALSSLVAPSLFSSSVEDQVVKAERMAESIPQGLLALLSNCTECTSELDRVRLSVALAASATGLVSKNIGEVRKSTTGKILFRGASELMRSTRFASVQGTEKVISRDSDEGKLCAFIYRHVTDRECFKFLDLVAEKNLDCAAEVLDWLSVLDGSRLPTTLSKLELFDSSMVARVMRVWSASAFSKDSAVLRPLSEARINKLEETLKVYFDDIDSLSRFQSEMKSLTEKILMSRNNTASLSFLEIRALKVCLCGLLRISPPEDLVSTIIHPVSVFLINSQDPHPPLSKRAKQSTNVNAEETAQMYLFYMRFLLLSSALKGIPIRATKFEEIVHVYFQYNEKQPEWPALIDLIRGAIETHPGLSYPVLPLLLSSLEIVSSSPPEDKILDDLAKLALSSCGFTEELSTLITKLSIQGGHERLLSKFKDRITAFDVQCADPLRSAIIAS